MPTFGLRYEEHEDEFLEWEEKVALVQNEDHLKRVQFEWIEVLGKLSLYDYQGRNLIARRIRRLDETTNERVPEA